MPNIIQNLGVAQSQWTQPYSYVPDARPVVPDYDLIEMFRHNVVERRQRIERWQSRVTWSCIVLATLVACYFAWQFAR